MNDRELVDGVDNLYEIIKALSETPCNYKIVRIKVAIIRCFTGLSWQEASELVVQKTTCENELRRILDEFSGKTVHHGTVASEAGRRCRRFEG